MKKLLIGLLAFLTFSAATAVVTHEYLRITAPVNYSQIRTATRLLYIDGLGNGSGVMIAPNRMLTAGHVALQDRDVTPLMLGVKRIKVLKIDEVLDIALLEVDANCPCVPLGDVPLVDSPTVLVGFPSNDTLHTQILTHGTFQGSTTVTNRLVSTSPGAPGNSGGGLFYLKDNRWYLAGILVEGAGTAIYGMYPQMIFHLTMSVHPDVIKKFIK